MSDEIEVGDTVNVYFMHRCIYGLRVVYTPCATGDSWRMLEISNNKIHYIQLFESIELLEKGIKQ